MSFRIRRGPRASYRLEWAIPAALLMVLSLAACGGGPPAGGGGQLTACESAVKTAADVDEMQDTVTDLDPAIRACGSPTELEAAAAKYPTALDGVAASTFVGNRCQYEPTLADSAICKALP